MKRYIKLANNSSTVEFNIDVYLPSAPEALIATKILDLPSDMRDADPLAIENYYAFREAVEEIFDYYDFIAVDEHTSNPSKYYYYAHKSQLDVGNVPTYVKVRISGHDSQHKSNEHKAKIKQETKETLERIKLPRSKMKQRYMPLYITVNSSQGFDTYEEALAYVESQVRDLFEILHLNADLSKYDELGEF